MNTEEKIMFLKARAEYRKGCVRYFFKHPVMAIKIFRYEFIQALELK